MPVLMIIAELCRATGTGNPWDLTSMADAMAKQKSCQITYLNCVISKRPSHTNKIGSKSDDDFLEECVLGK